MMRHSIVTGSILWACLLTPVHGQVRSLAPPAGEGSSLPFLAAAPDGRVFMSWVEPAGGKGHALKFSALGETTWSAPRTIAEGTGWFVNWADFPSLAILPDGSMAAHWLARSGPDTYAYDVRIVRSFDGGATWTDPLTPHRDSTQTEHGFVSMFPAPGGELGAVWLDGREMAGDDGKADSGGSAAGHSHGNMTLRYAAIRESGGGPGTPAAETVLDAMVCECCQTSAAITADGPMIVYRDRLEGGIRDISAIRWLDGAWTTPQTVSRDGWKIDGCPVNGPAIDARDSLVAVAWFTAAGDTPKVKIAFSEDAGANFGPPVVVDDGSPSGRVDVVLLDDGSAVVSWLERVGGAGEVRMRPVARDGQRAAAVTIAPSGTARSSGFPRMVRSGKKLVFAWTAGTGVQTALLTLP